MIRSRFVRAATLTVMTVVVAAAACTRGTHPYTSLGADAAALKAQFNRDAGKVRLVMLVAPT